MQLRKLLALGLTLVSVISFSSPASADAIRDRQYWIGDYGFDKVWKITKGAGVMVAIIDTGIDSTHPDLLDAVLDGTDVSLIGDSRGQTPIGEISYHGTMVASILAGRGHGEHGEVEQKSKVTNPGGVIGVAPEAQLLSVSMAFGQANLDTDAQVAKGIVWAVDAGAKVINLSLTRNSKDWPQSWDDAFLYAFEKDVVIVAAAGNRGGGTQQVGAPATIPGVLSVAGVDQNANASDQASTSGLTIGVSAPATDLVSAYPGGDYKVWSGSSGAAPIVSGLVALIRSKYPNLDANNVINRVISTATQVGPDDYSTVFGYGLIDPLSALTAKIEPVSDNPLGSLKEWVGLYRKSTTDQTQQQSDEMPGKINVPVEPNKLSNTSEFDTTQIVPIAIYGVFGVLVAYSIISSIRRRKRAGGPASKP